MMFRYIMICVNDILIITGSVLKELIELRQTSGDLWNFCSVFLGTGSLLVWIGMLRYLIPAIKVTLLDDNIHVVRPK